MYCFVLGDGVKFIKNGVLNNIVSSVLKFMGFKVLVMMDEFLF